MCHFEENVVKTERFHDNQNRKPTHVVGLSTIYPQHVGVSMLLQEIAIATVIFEAKETRPC
jgi:hypothetical protein